MANSKNSTEYRPGAVLVSQPGLYQPALPYQEHSTRMATDEKCRATIHSSPTPKNRRS